MSDYYGHLLSVLVERERTASFGFIAPVVTVESISALDADIKHLQVDMMTFEPTAPINPSQADAQAFVGQVLKLGALRDAFTRYKSEWDIWKNEHTGGLSRTGFDPQRQFETFRVEYNDHLRQFTESFGVDKTGAKPHEQPTTPLGGAAKSALSAVNVLVYAGLIAAGAYAYSQVKKK